LSFWCGPWIAAAFSPATASPSRRLSFRARTAPPASGALDDVVVDLDAGVTIRGAAFYEDAYRRGADGVWRICRTGYSRIYEERFPRASLPGLELTASYWETGGRSRIEV